MIETDGSRLRYDDEIRMVDAILKQTDRTVRPNGALFLAWGIGLAIVDAIFFAHYTTRGIPSVEMARFIATAITGGLLALTGIALALGVRRTQTVVDRQVAIGFATAAVVLLVAVNLRYPQWLFPGGAYGVVQLIAFCIPTISIAVQYRDRVLLAAALALIAALVAIRIWPASVDLCACLGVTAGLIAPGCVYVARGAGLRHG